MNGFELKSKGKSWRINKYNVFICNTKVKRIKQFNISKEKLKPEKSS
jgi:hypothetical protein